MKTQRTSALCITLDPEKDTSEALKQYLLFFDTRFVGLTGDKRTISTVVEEFKV